MTAAALPRLGAEHGVLVTLMVISAFINLPQQVVVGGISGGGLLTIAETALVVVTVLACGPFPRRLVVALGPYAAFLLWAVASQAWGSVSSYGTQNLIVWLLFGSVILLAGTAAARSAAAMDRALDVGIRVADWIAPVLVILGFLIQGLPQEDSDRAVAPRSFALVALVPLSWHLAKWHYGRVRSGPVAALWFMCIGLTLSRTATAIALVYLLIVWLLRIRWTVRAIVNAAAVAAVIVAGATALLLATPIADRMFSGDASLKVGGVAINGMGRAAVWAAVTDSAWRAPFIGHGIASSQAIAREFQGLNHPHNDYLRVWHDLGFIGLALFCSAFAVMLTSTFRKWRACQGRAEQGAAIQLAALLGLSGVLASSLTDNAVVYPYVMSFVGILVGAAMGMRPQASHGTVLRVIR